MIADAHAHLGQGREKRLTPVELLTQMDRNGVDRAVVCPVEEQIILHNREGNESIREAVRAYPDRLIGFATVNPWYGDAAVQELRRAVGEGLVGLKINSSLQGYALTHELLLPVLEATAALDVPVYAHTGTPVRAEPFQLAYLARRFPEVDFIMGHSGASDFWNDVIPAARLAPNIYLETSKTTPVTILGLLAQEPALGERILFGSNLPASSYELELSKVRQAVSEPELLGRVLGSNLLGLLARHRGGHG